MYNFYRKFLKILLSIIYKIEIKGIDNLYAVKNEKTVIIANHVSYIDPALISLFLPYKIVFAINSKIAKIWWIKPFLKIVETYSLDTTNAMAIKTLIKKVKLGEKIAIFPEGRTSTTGSMMKIYAGPALIAYKTNAKILPIMINGTEFTAFSKIKKLFCTKIKFRKKLTVKILPAVVLDINNNSDSKINIKKILTEQLYGIMSDARASRYDMNTGLFKSLIDAGYIYGMNKKILEDISNVITYRKIISRAFLYRKYIVNNTKIDSNQDGMHYQSKYSNSVAIVLPNSIEYIVSLFAIHSLQKIAFVVNYNQSQSLIFNVLQASNAQLLITSKKIIKDLALEGLIISIEKIKIATLYIEDILINTSIIDRTMCYLSSFVPEFYYKKISNNQKKLNSASLILQSSSKKNNIKLLMFSDLNIRSNILQITSNMEISPQDIVFSSINLYHGYSLITSYLSLLTGAKNFLYPYLSNYSSIPEIIYSRNITIVFSTPILSHYYAIYADSYDLRSIKSMILSLDHLHLSSKKILIEKCKTNIYECYFHESSLMISLNTLTQYKGDSMGKILPKIQYYLKPCKTNLKLGYLQIKSPSNSSSYIEFIHNTEHYIQNIKNEILIETTLDYQDTEELIFIGNDFITSETSYITQNTENLYIGELLEHIFRNKFLGTHIILCIKSVFFIFTNDTISNTKLLDILHQFKIYDESLLKRIIILKLNELEVNHIGQINYSLLENYLNKK
ncbi:1-acyl-sn-glycerol-3-phosphate acyltransferase [Rickettsia endosymbiont of Cardiosporidium cionae]|uniref:1-acyl-sn-glycerol-3-phosphate acyltransferase n=1 Tax=Rickettsia endosymbiont of Cardiosporidium cionae TaxID=2777155 RepID=UPI001893749A|nr:1-acyl-sn-glycerol-3-phosphate acyltransferase [Rickettsia endosymbiont of Cardiosporidium cionae]